MTHNFNISVVIATYNRSRSVRRILEALSAQTFPADQYEVIISIDGSNDETRATVDNFESSYELRSIWHPNSGRASACNRGIRAAAGEIVVILDDDMEPAPGLLAAHYDIHKSRSGLGVVGAVPIKVDESSSPVVRYVGAKFNSHLCKISAPGYRIRIRDFYSGNFSIGREDMLKHGMYNEEFKIYGNEDVELAYRLLKAGLTLVYSSEALCIQNYDKDFAGLAKDTVSKGKNAVLLCTKYPDTFPELKLREYNSSGWKWRMLRSILLRAGVMAPATSSAVASIVGLIQSLGIGNRNIEERIYPLALDYFFWLGVWSALKSDGDTVGLAERIKSYDNG